MISKLLGIFFLLHSHHFTLTPKIVKNAVRAVKGARELFGSSKINSSKFDLKNERKCQI